MNRDKNIKFKKVHQMMKYLLYNEDSPKSTLEFICMVVTRGGQWNGSGYGRPVNKVGRVGSTNGDLLTIWIGSALLYK